MKTRKIAGREVGAIGLGCMYLSIQGRPDDDEAVKTLLRGLALGVTLLDTANVYCTDDSDIGRNERLIARALRERGGPGTDVIVATKGGLARPNGSWTRSASPPALRSACEKSLRDLGVDAIELYQLHAPDPKVPLEESVGELAKLKSEGKIRHVGLSNVSVKELDVASKIVPIVSVQNRWNPSDRSPEHDGVLEACTARGIAFLPYSPFGGARGAKGLGELGTLSAVARERGVSPHRLVLAWMLARSPIVLPIPGVRRIASVEDSVEAAALELSPAECAAVEASF